MAVYIRTKALFVDEEGDGVPTEEFAITHIQGDSAIIGINESDIEGYIEIRYHSGSLVSIKGTMAEFDSKLRELGNEVIQ